MSWILKQAEDILNRVDQQTNAAFQAQQKPKKTHQIDHEIEFISESASSRSPANYFLPIPIKNSTTISEIETNRKNFIDQTEIFVNQVTVPLENDHRRDELIESLKRENQDLIEKINKFDRDQQTIKRQILQYQQQINESDALLGHLRSRESDTNEILAAKDSQLGVLRVRLNEVEQLLSLANQQLENQSSRSRNDRSNEDLVVLQGRLNQIEQEKQQNQQWKSLFQQLEQEFNEYKTKAQRILQNKDETIKKLNKIAQHRSSTPNLVDPSNENENQILTGGESTVFDLSQISVPTTNIDLFQNLTIQNEKFKNDLQIRETIISQCREEIQRLENQLEQSKENFRRELVKLNEQLDDERQRSNLLKQDFLSTQEEFKKDKKSLQIQIYDREHDLERLRQQLTSKTINQVHDEDVERRLQTLTESILLKQSLIENLQTEKSSLSLKLERLEQRLDDYEKIRRTNKDNYSHLSTMSIGLDENDSLENIRHRLPLLHETPTDVQLTKKVKRAANELDRWAMRLTIFLRRYPFIRLFVLLYILVLHLWTFIVLCTYATDMHN